MQKTFAMKVLEGKKVAYATIPYPETMRDAREIADHLGVPAAQVFKTLVILPPTGKPFLVMVAANRHINLKKLAKEVTVKKVKMASHKEAERLTGLRVGGISALALLNKGFIIYLDESVRTHDTIYISGGQRGLNLQLSVSDLTRVTKAKWIDASDDESTPAPPKPHPPHPPQNCGQK